MFPTTLRGILLRESGRPLNSLITRSLPGSLAAGKKRGVKRLNVCLVSFHDAALYFLISRLKAASSLRLHRSRYELRYAVP